jgi:hypothetical protein
LPYSYYSKLKASDRAIYRQSDAIEVVSLPPGVAGLRPVVKQLEESLANEDRKAIERAVRELTANLLQLVDVRQVTIKVLAARPSDDWGELHGLYEEAEGRRRARITVWMRTAHHKKVIAFRTFLRTVLHEICHHLDYELFNLADSFHTEGFFKRESSLFHQLVPMRPS